MAPNYGPPVNIDGPAPSPPALTLVGAARDVTPPGDRWINGAAIWPYPRDLPDVFDPCQPSSSAGHSKDPGTATAEELFGAYNVLEGISCTTRSTHFNPAEWQRRAGVALEAYKHWAIEREFAVGALKPDNPHLGQVGSGSLATVTLNGGAATSVKNGIALLEQQIANLGGNGVIHIQPSVFSQLSQEGGGSLLEVKNGQAKTYLGTPVVPGVGYTGSAPDGTVQAGTVTWGYATGQVELMMSPVSILPDSITQATDRMQNFTTFRAECYVLVPWDQRIHAAVKIDRAFTTFTS